MLSIYLLGAALLVVLDQLIKAWAIYSLQPLGTIPLIPNVLHLTYSENRGAAFSILTGHTELLLVVTGLMLAGLLYLLLSKRLKRWPELLSISLILAGGLGNLLDRAFRPGHFVVDYIDFRLINFAIFNLADICVCCGCGLFMIYLLFFEGKGERHEG